VDPLTIQSGQTAPPVGVDDDGGSLGGICYGVRISDAVAVLAS
jgi:hypothetical protein